MLQPDPYKGVRRNMVCQTDGQTDGQPSGDPNVSGDPVGTDRQEVPLGR